jgi:DNA polymerase I-like protein with 3'-5' exonuclease and polymerase domains
VPTDASNAPGPITWVTMPSDLEQLKEAIRGCSEAVIDLETTGLDEHAVTGGPTNGGVSARISLASFTLPQRAVYGDVDSGWDGVDPTTYVLPLSHPNSPWLGTWRKVLAAILAVLVEADRPLENANVKFDAKWIYAQTGIDLSELIVWDTQVSSHLLDENASTRLKDRAPKTFGIPPWDDHDLTYPGASEEVELYALGEYAARDTYWTWRLVRHHRTVMFLDGDHQPEDNDEIIAARLGRLSVWVAMPMVGSLTRIEQNGMRLDVPWVKDKLAEDDFIHNNALDWIADRYELPRKAASLHSTSGWFKTFADRAVQSGDLMVTAMTPNNVPSWGKSVLIRQARHGSEAAAMLLEGRQAAKRAEYLRSWLHYVTPRGYVHTTYWPGRVITGRLSSESPNMQQVTRSLKPAFIPSDGYYHADLDYSQIELRVAAFVSRCQPMLDAFNRGDDLHRLLAAQITRQSPLDVTSEQRTRAKPANFGLLYDMSPGGYRDYAEDAYDVVLTEEEAVEAHGAFFELWVGMREWHDRVKARASRYGYVTSPLGRVRRLPDIWDGNEFLRGMAERRAINSPIQSFASDLMQMAAASIQGFLPGSTAIHGVRLVGTVHDDIIAEVPINRWRESVEEMQDRMVHLDRELARMEVHFDVPLIASATVGTRWGLDDISLGEM